MKKLLSTNYSDTAFNVAMLVLRSGLGIVMLPHGYQKLVHFAEYRTKFFNLFSMGSTLSLSLAIFAELVCSIFLILGLFTRTAALVLALFTSVIIFKVNNGTILGKSEFELTLLLGFFTLLLVGGGKYSVEGGMGK